MKIHFEFDYVVEFVFHEFEGAAADANGSMFSHSSEESPVNNCD